MAGTDGRPDGEDAPAPDPAPGPGGGPPQPSGDGAPPPGDDGPPPDEARPGHRSRRRDWERISVSIAAASFAVGTGFSFAGSVLAYLSTVATRDSVVVAREALEDTQKTEHDEILRDLARIAFDIRPDGGRTIIEIRNWSSRPFIPTMLSYSYVPELLNDSDPRADGSVADKSDSRRAVGILYHSRELMQLPSCTMLRITLNSGLDSKIVRAEENNAYFLRALVGIDVLSPASYKLDSMFGPSLFNVTEEEKAANEVERLEGDSTMIRMDNC